MSERQTGRIKKGGVRISCPHSLDADLLLE